MADKYYDASKASEYGYGSGVLGTVGNIMDAGAKKRGETVSRQIADMDNLVGGLTYDMQYQAGAIDAETRDKSVADHEAQVADDFKSNMSDVTGRSLLNIVTNSAGVILSGAAAYGTFGAKGISESLAKTAAATAKSEAGRTAGQVATNVLANAGSVGFKVASKMPIYLKAGITAAPAVATGLYTSGKTDQMVLELNETLKSLQASYEYLSSEDESLTDTIKADTAEWKAHYEAGSQELLDAYQSGQISKEEYDTRFEAFVQESNDKWDEVKQGHADTAMYVTEHGVAYATDEYIASHGYDPDMIDKKCQTIAKYNEDNPDAYEAAKTKYETMERLDTGSTFTNFIANLNATILHYAPGFAYVEAAALKAADVVMGFVGNKIPGLSSVISYTEQHKGEGIGEMAKAICTDASARYELSHSMDAASAVLDAGKSAPTKDAAAIAEEIAATETPDTGPTMSPA